MQMIANTVGELRHLLDKLPVGAVPYTIEPPFIGVQLVPQSDGAILICRIEQERGPIKPSGPDGL